MASSPMLAHVGGVPVEELVPLALSMGGVASAWAAAMWRRMGSARRRAEPRRGAGRVVVGGDTAGDQGDAVDVVGAQREDLLVRR